LLSFKLLRLCEDRPKEFAFPVLLFNNNVTPVTEHHAMKVYRGVKVMLNLFYIWH
jgi:hypothetical protein